MTMTKAEELKVLTKIERLIANTGEGSYLSMSFEGFGDLARDNIRNDWGCSYPERFETMSRMLSENDADVFAIKKAHNQEIRALKAEIENLNTAIFNADSERERATQERDEALRNLEIKQDTLKNLYNEDKLGFEIQRKKRAELEAQLKEKDLEIMKLKVMLFDLTNK